MNIKDAAKAVGLTPDTIRFYERTGVLPRPPRRPNGYRHYTEEHVATFRLAKGLRQFGLPLRDVAPILAVAHDGTCHDVRQTMVGTFTQTLEDLDTKILELTRAREHLAALLRGLRRMKPTELSVPGVQPCECIRLVSSE